MSRKKAKMLLTGIVQGILNETLPTILTENIDGNLKWHYAMPEELKSDIEDIIDEIMDGIKEELK